MSAIEGRSQRLTTSDVEHCYKLQPVQGEAAVDVQETIKKTCLAASL